MTGEVFAKSVKDIGLSFRAWNAINNQEIKTVGELVDWLSSDKARLAAKPQGIYNFGKKSLNELREAIAELGISLPLTRIEMQDRVINENFRCFMIDDPEMGVCVMTEYGFRPATKRKLRIMLGEMANWMEPDRRRTLAVEFRFWADELEKPRWGD